MSADRTDRTDDAPGDAEHIVLTFRPTGAGPPFAVRIRHLLKTALRAYGLRCTRIAGRIDDPPAADPGGTPRR